MSNHTLPTYLGWDDVYIVPTQDGSDTLFSMATGTTYHSKFGAVGESKHVFLQKGLMTLMGRAKISILEFGFGTGLNAFLAYLFAIKYDKKVSYTGIEAFPIDPEVAEKLDYPAYLSFPEERVIFHQMHRLDAFKAECFEFQKVHDLSQIPDLVRYDCIFFDAFDPVCQSALWEQQVFDRLYQLTSEGGCLVTYCAQGEVRRRMTRAGYMVERLPGPPGKREMMRAVRR